MASEGHVTRTSSLPHGTHKLGQTKATQPASSSPQLQLRNRLPTLGRGHCAVTHLAVSWQLAEASGRGQGDLRQLLGSLGGSERPLLTQVHSCASPGGGR